MRKIFCAQRLPWGPLLCQISHPMGSFLGAAFHPIPWDLFEGCTSWNMKWSCRCTLFICPEIIRSKFVVWNICRPSTHFPFEDRKVACREATCQCQRIWTFYYSSAGFNGLEWKRNIWWWQKNDNFQFLNCSTYQTELMIEGIRRTNRIMILLKSGSEKPFDPYHYGYG